MYELAVGRRPIRGAGAGICLPRCIHRHHRWCERHAETASDALVLVDFDGDKPPRVDATGLLEHSLEVLQRERRLSVAFVDTRRGIPKAQPVLSQLRAD